MRDYFRSNFAQSAVELIAGTLVLIPLIFVIIDLSVIIMASFQNDSICREACRAAASADPKDCAKIAEAEVSKYNTKGGFASYKLQGSPDTSKIELPSSGHGLIGGSVKVKTAAEVHAPFLIGFLIPDCHLEAEQSFPFTYTIP